MNPSPVSKALERFPEDWARALAPEFQTEYMGKLREFLKSENQKGFHYFPLKDKIFYALEVLPLEKVRVVILGQDPYHGKGQANGLAFSVTEGIPAPPSLQNIFKEIENDIGSSPKTTNLEFWARQGVLLLNTVLTVRQDKALSHREKGWEIFTDKIISILNEREKPIVFLLWGASAQDKEELISAKKHIVLRAPHPSPLSAYRGFFGCKHFSKTNEILKEWGEEPIHWDQYSISHKTQKE